MKRDPAYASASGLRPASAFVVIALVLLLVGLKVGRDALATEAPPEKAPQSESDPGPEYMIVDREGRQMALFVQRLDLELSPNALFQAHTPDRLATRLSAALGGRPTPRELLDAMLPDARRGVVTLEERLVPEQARKLDEWLRKGSGAGEIDGMWLDAAPGGVYVLRWRPEVTLGQEMRERHVPNNKRNPLRYSQFLADGIGACLWGELPRGTTGVDAKLLRERREQVWALLLPSTYAVALRNFDARHAPAVAQVLTHERVAGHQLRIARGRERMYPAGSTPLLGRWGYVDQNAARGMALRELGVEALPASDDLAPLEEVERLTRRILSEQHPLSGLERACDALLEDPAWAFLQRDGAKYSYQRHRPVLQGARSYFLEAVEASPPPRVLTTFDALLQRQVGVELEALMEKHAPAVAMAIVIDVASGDVLALDARDCYQLQGYPPLYHAFTPGSTAKVLVMAAALEAGVVRAEERFNVGYGGECVVHGRVIHEAEHSREGVLSAAEVLAHSLNAGMAQIGTRIPDTVLRGTLTALGYGRTPRTELSGERPGYLTPLPWRRSQTHASVSFGHEMLVTFWQHAAGLATVIRGGESRPLRLLDAVEQQGRRWSLPYEVPTRVLSEGTCAQVRDMMRLGAREGTGSAAATAELMAGLDVGTKTGTAEKVATELCVHVELADQLRHHQLARAGKPGSECSKACRRALKGQKKPHGRSCYTSSMVIFGRRQDGSGREVMVLVVADEPRGREKFGSRVAGPTAVAILREALGVTTFGEQPVAELPGGFLPSSVEAPRGSEQPWAEGRW